MICIHILNTNCTCIIYFNSFIFVDTYFYLYLEKNNFDTFGRSTEIITITIKKQYIYFDGRLCNVKVTKNNVNFFEFEIWNLSNETNAYHKII